MPWHPEDWYRAIRNFLFPIEYDKRDNRAVKHIRFVGVWDTVAAYGLPMDEMTRGVSRWIVPLELPNHTLNRKYVMRACQALALTKHEPTFHPELWDEGRVRRRNSIQATSATLLMSNSVRSGSQACIPT